MNTRRWWNLVPHAPGWAERPPGWVAAKSEQRLQARVTWQKKDAGRVADGKPKRGSAKRPTPAQRENDLFAAAMARARAELAAERKGAGV